MYEDMVEKNRCIADYVNQGQQDKVEKSYGEVVVFAEADIWDDKDLI